MPQAHPGQLPGRVTPIIFVDQRPGWARSMNHPLRRRSAVHRRHRGLGASPTPRRSLSDLARSPAVAPRHRMRAPDGRIRGSEGCGHASTAPSCGCPSRTGAARSGTSPIRFSCPHAGRPTLHDREMPRRDLALDTDLVVNGIGNAPVALPPHPRHVKLWKTMRSHLASLPVVATNQRTSSTSR